MRQVFKSNFQVSGDIRSSKLLGNKALAVLCQMTTEGRNFSWINEIISTVAR